MLSPSWMAGCLLLAMVSVASAQVPHIDSNHPYPLWSQPLNTGFITLSPDCTEECEDCTEGEEPIYLVGGNDPWRISPKDAPLQFGGWTQVGYATHDAPTFGAFGLASREDRLQSQQQWFYLEKVIDPAPDGFDWGARIDYVFGSDFPSSVAVGGQAGDWDLPWNDGRDYGHAIPQLYLQLAYGDLSVKVGHFFTILGYETTPAPYNFFFTRAISNQGVLPKTHSGALAEYAVSDNVTVYGGWTAGYDTGFTRNGGSNFLGGISVLLTEDLLLSYITSIGDQGFGGPVDHDAYQHTLTLTADLTERLRTALVYGLWDDQSFGASQQQLHHISNYYYYQLMETVALGIRGEWQTSNNRDQGAFTAGMNWQPHANVTLRPEYRRDMFQGGTDPNQFAIDLIVTY